MKQKRISTKGYSKKNPSKVKTLRKAVKKGVKQYAETFRRLANT